MAEGLRLASLAMYRDPPVIAEATRALWADLAARLTAAGLAGVSAALDEVIAHDAAWLDPQLLLAQTCGYPLVTQLGAKVRLVATPIYRHPGCIGALGGSFVIVRADAGFGAVADLRGAVAAINDWGSNSGMNLLRRTLAPHAVEGRFLGGVAESGSHRASIAMVAGGRADVAAIDCVTFGNLARFAPEVVAGVRILAETAKTPGLPLITRGTAHDREIALLRGALADLALDPATAGLRDLLGLEGFASLEMDDYDAVLALEREAAALGYPVLG
ncbi:phosphate ABC transporter substrate-binding protein [Novosphingobium sediminis]|uniref:Phosphate ABC transporter substrate-binding protein n=1 Tax=Novosphingobium sediminis TaxID=707214 RepID=A0A512AKQ6_9SPHN|nr:PhnD/SsuA/transferrin family substrate-binding protein [Novosphingobium sediminis]GEO00264.1 phosphate ABC transporter substrate-binding protein [Novosphingobium sediminis]